MSYEYTAKGNLIALVTNGTRVLGLGNIGPVARKPVMEGKSVLFKRFADIDVFDLEVNSEKPEDVIRFWQLLEPTVGGINLEDIRTPECFFIEETLRRTISIPVRWVALRRRQFPPHIGRQGIQCHGAEAPRGR